MNIFLIINNQNDNSRKQRYKASCRYSVKVNVSQQSDRRADTDFKEKLGQLTAFPNPLFPKFEKITGNVDQRCAPVYQVSSSYLQPFPRYCIWTVIFWGIPHFLDICTIDFPENLKNGRGQDPAIILKVWTIFIKPFLRKFDFWVWLEPEPVKKNFWSTKKVHKKYKKVQKK
jgi:hypothetical protein